jgi:hypothetical protein
MKSILLLISFIFLYQVNIHGQDKNSIQYGEVSLKDFMLPSSPVADSTSAAIIIADIGKIYFTGNKTGYFQYVFNYFTRIKLLNKNSFDELATLKINLYGKEEFKDQLTDFKATVYNLQDGKLVSASLNQKDLFEDKISPYHSVNKISLPAIKEGSLIEYSYTITSYRYYAIPSWNFQWQHYPCLYNECEVLFPDLLPYAAIRIGSDPFYKDETSTVKNSKYYIGIATIISNDIKKRWIMKDIPSFKKEDFIFAPKDYLDRLEFTLAPTNDQQNVVNLNTSWETITKDLLRDSYFGAPVEKENTVNLFNLVEKITVSDNNMLESAHHLFSYVRDNFICIPDDDIFLYNDLYNINKKKKGSVTDLNMLLIGLLRQKGISADPVILSTREYGKNSAAFPVLEKFNYVICMARIADDTIYLDATKPYLGFGQLPLECYNGHARIISNNGGPVYFNPEDIREQQSTAVFIVNDSKDKSAGWVEMNSGAFNTEKIRMEIKGSGIKKYIENIRSEMTNETEMQNAGIDSLDKPGNPVKFHFDFDVPAQKEILYFNPVILTGLKQNPFKPDIRKYPVTFPMPVNELYTLSMQIPDGYVVDELPKPAKVSFNENEGFFEYLVQANQKNIQLRSRISLPKVSYPPEDYQSLRDFYTFIVAKLSEQIVFKKKKE